MIDLNRKLGEVGEELEAGKPRYVESDAEIHRKKADFKPEVFFCGQVVGGDEFET